VARSLLSLDQQSEAETHFLAEPAESGWNRLGYGEALAKVRSVAQFLLERGLSAEPRRVLHAGQCEYQSEQVAL